MAELDNAKRSLERATYTPLEQRRGRRPPREGRAWDKWGYAAGLRVTAKEAAAVVQRLTSGRAARSRNLRSDLQRLAALLVAEGETPSSLPLDRAKQFEAISPELLLKFGTELAAVREEEVKGHLRVVTEIAGAWHVAPAGAAPPADQIPSHLKLDRNAVVGGIPNARVFRFREQKKLPSPTRRAAGSVQPAEGTQGELVREEAILMQPEAPPLHAEVAPTPPTSITRLLEWGIHSGVQTKPASDVLAAARSLDAGQTMTAYQFGVAAQARVNATRDLNFFFKERMRVEPVGLLHLERLSFIPAGIERGELVHSVPLSPAEQVNISHKEWSNTSEEFERIVTDFLEAFSEEGVTEKSELTQSTRSQSEHSSGFNLGVTASGGYGPVSISTTVGFNVAELV